VETLEWNLISKMSSSVDENCKIDHKIFSRALGKDNTTVNKKRCVGRSDPRFSLQTCAVRLKRIEALYRCVKFLNIKLLIEECCNHNIWSSSSEKRFSFLDYYYVHGLLFLRLKLTDLIKSVI
jgi:hypothetical protein